MARVMKDSRVEWIGEIPEGWGTNTAFQLFTQVKNKNEGLKEQNLLSLSYGKIKRKSIETVSGLLPESFDGYNIIEPDDIVLRLTDLQNDQKSLRVGLSPERGIVTSAYLTLRNRSTSLPKYLYYYLHAFDISKGFYGMGAGVRQGLNWDGLKWLKILTPPVSEQKKIVSLLDGECARIDAVIEQTRASIEEYKKLKQSVITQAVTKGIRPSRKMKDSGVEWIGEIPENWKHRKLKSFISIPVVDGPHESPELFDTGIPYISATAIVNGIIDFSQRRGFISEEYCDECDKRYKPQVGDILVIKLGASTGQVAIVDSEERFNIWVPLAAVRCSSLVNSKFIYYCFQSDYLIRQMQLSWTFGTQQTLGVKTIEALKFFIPPIEEQDEIIEHLNEKCYEINILLEKKQQLLEELESYKKSLIFEYVTGKKEVGQ